MPDSKITALASIGTGTDPANDPLVVVDVSDTSMAASGTTKKVTLNQLLGAGGAGVFSSINNTGNTTLGDSQSDTATINGQLTARQGEFPSAVRAAASDYAAVAFDGATASTRITSTLTGQNIGTGDFSVWARFRVPASVNAVNRGLVALTSNATATAQAESAHLFLAANAGELALRLYGATTSDIRQATINGFLAAYTGQVVDVVVTRTGTTVKIYINGTDTAYIETTSGTPPAWSAAVTSTFCDVGMAVGASLFTGRIYRSVVFNRALSASDVTELITIGVNPADQWGTQTQIANTTTLNGGFETAGGGGADPFANWVEFTTGTTTITRDTTVFSPNLSSTASANFTTDALNSGANITLSNTLLPSKRFRLLFDFRHNGTAAAGPQYNIGSGSDIVGTATAPNTWTSYVVESIAGGTAFAFSRASGAGASKTSWYDNAIIERIGAIVDLDFTVGTGYQATDRSTNALHGTLFNGVEFTQPKRVAVLYATTNTATNQQVFGTLAIPTNAIIEDIIVNSTGTATVTIRDAVAGNIIVNAASVVAGRQKLTIAQPFSSTGNLWVNSSTTATLQFTILYTIAA